MHSWAYFLLVIIKDTVVSDSYYLLMQNFYVGLVPTEVELIC